MTKEEMIALQQRGVPPTPTRLAIPCQPNGFTPTPQNYFNEGIPQSPRPEDFNGIPLMEMEFQSKFKHMDGMHKGDALAREYQRGTGLKELSNSLGKERFANIYKVLKHK